MKPTTDLALLTLLALLASTLLLGTSCSSDAPSDDDDSTTAPGDDDDDSTPEGTASVSGRVVNEQGEPIANLSVSLCGAVCLIQPTTEDGSFVFEGVRQGTKVIEPTLVPAGDDLSLAVRSWSRFFDLVDVADGEAVEVPHDFILRQVPEVVGPLLGFQELSPLPDLQLRFDADEVLADGPLPVGAEDVWLGAVSIPQADWPTGGLGDWTVQAAWTLAIWDLEAEDAFEVTATLPSALDEGAEVAFLVADYTYGFTNGRFFEEAAELDAQRITLRTAENAGLDRTTLWLAVSRSTSTP